MSLGGSKEAKIPVKIVQEVKVVGAWCTVKEYVAIYDGYTERHLRRLIAAGKFRRHRHQKENHKILIELTEQAEIETLKDLRDPTNTEMEKPTPQTSRICFYCTRWEREVLRVKAYRNSFLAFLEQELAPKFEVLSKETHPAGKRPATSGASRFFPLRKISRSPQTILLPGQINKEVSLEI